MHVPEEKEIVLEPERDWTIMRQGLYDSYNSIDWLVQRSIPPIMDARGSE